MSASNEDSGLIDSKAMAKLLGVSVKFIEKNRVRLAGAVKIGRIWRFDPLEVKSRIATGRDLLLKRR
jgi:hypothetical protein